ncbi:MAG: NfeD family protein [candidate division Zixibacteria bacterium]
MIIFATIFGVGFLILIFSLIFGHDIDADVDADVEGGPSIFSVKIISLLMVGFGALSFGVRATTEATMFISSMAGVGGALVVGGIGYAIIRVFYASQASSTITDRDIIGSIATLIDAIPENGNGQVSVVLRGREITFLARSKDNSSINRGNPVRILSKSGNIVTVEPAE